jgi:hypothetical protein
MHSASAAWGQHECARSRYTAARQLVEGTDSHALDLVAQRRSITSARDRDVCSARDRDVCLKLPGGVIGL